MLATLAALHLAVLSQVAPPPREVTPDDTIAQEDAAAEDAPAGANPPLPRKGEQPPPPAAPGAAEAEAAPTTVTPARPRQLSFLSADPLGGGSLAFAWAGWTSLGLMYGQGITERDDLAGFADYDWEKSELRLGGFYRRPLGTAGAFDMAGRLSAAWYLNFGADYFEDENHSDSGLELVPGLSFSSRGARGIFSIIGEAPLTITTKYGAGLLFSPRASVAYEGLLYPELSVGARLGLGYRAGSGDAPLSEGQAEVMFLVVAGYQIL